MAEEPQGTILEGSANETPPTEAPAEAINNAPSGETQSFVDSDGKFSENWRNGLSEDIRDEKSLEGLGNLSDLAKSFINTKKALGQRQVDFPSDKSSEEDWNSAYDKLGRPDEADKYEINRNETIPEQFREAEGLDSFKEVFHKAGLNQKQVNMILEQYDTNVLAQLENGQNQIKDRYDNDVATLKKDWGTNFNQQVEKASAVANSRGYKEAINSAGLGSNPVVLKILADFGDSIGGDKLIQSKTKDNSFDVIEQELASLSKDPAYRDKGNFDHDAKVERYNYLIQRKFDMQAK